MELNTSTTTATGAVVGVDVAALLATEKVFVTHTVTVLTDDDGNHSAGFEIVGKNSAQYQAAVRETTKASIKRGQVKKTRIDGKTDEGAGKLYDLGADNNKKIAMAVVVGCPGFLTNGVQASPTPELLDNLFTKFPTWVDQIIAALEVESNFLKV